MREATILLITIVILSVIGGIMYNVMSPYLREAGIIGGEEGAQIATDGGIFVSRDEGFSWAKIGTLPEMEAFLKSDVFSVLFDPGDENRAYIGTSTGLYVYSQVSGNISSIPAGLGMVQSVAVDQSNKNRMYLAVKSGSGGKILKATRPYYFYEVYSTLGANSGKQDNVLGVWINRSSPNVVYAGTETGLFLESENFGESWFIKAEFKDKIRMLEMASNDAKTMYAIVGNAGVFKTKNGGATWSDISNSLSSYGAGFNFLIENIAIDPRDNNRLYAATSRGLLKSINGGSSFSRMELLSPEESPHILYVALDPLRDNVVYFAIGLQIHKTEDGGKNWKIKTLSGQRGVSAIKINPVNSKTIIVGLRTVFVQAAVRK